jgi:hypothetical protein
LKTGLVNVIALGWYFVSCPRLGSVPAHTGWYETPSKSLSVPMHPPIGTNSEKAALKQPTSSPSSSSSLLARQLPPSSETTEQYSKWPISSDAATL